MRSRQERLYHLALASDWDTALAGNTGYRTSTLGLDLADVGFIHCSYADQVREIADRIYHDRDDVVLLTIDQQRLTSRVVDEAVEGSDVEYPHIYGPVDTEAVVEITPLSLRPDGTLDLPVPNSEGPNSEGQNSEGQNSQARSSEGRESEGRKSEGADH